MAYVPNPQSTNDAFMFHIKQKDYLYITFVAAQIEHLMLIYEDKIDSIKNCGDILVYRILKLLIKMTEFPVEDAEIFEKKIDAWMKENCKIFFPICVILFHKEKCSLKKLPYDLIRYCSEFLDYDQKAEQIIRKTFPDEDFGDFV